MRSARVAVCGATVCGPAPAQGSPESAAADAGLQACAARVGGDAHVMACPSPVLEIAGARRSHVDHAWTSALNRPKPRAKALEAVRGAR